MEITKEQVIKIGQYRPRWNRHVDLNALQLQMYKQLIYGLKSYTAFELSKLSEETQRSIIYNNEWTWRIINRLKQEKLNKKVRHVLHSVFPDLYANETTKILTEEIYDNQFEVKLKEITLQNGEIIDTLIAKHLLPKSFYNL